MSLTLNASWGLTSKMHMAKILGSKTVGGKRIGRKLFLLGVLIIIGAYGFWWCKELGFGLTRAGSRDWVARSIVKQESQPEMVAALRNPDAELITYLGSIVKEDAQAYRYESALYHLQNFIPERIKSKFKWNRSPMNLRYWALRWLHAYWRVPGETSEKASHVLVDLLNYPKDEVRGDTLTSFYLYDSSLTAGMLPHSGMEVDVNLAAHSRVARALVARLEQENGQNKYDAIRAVGSLNSATNWVVEPLVKILGEHDESNRRLAVLRLSELGVRRSEMIPPLLEGMHDSGPEMRVRFAQALGDLGLPDARVSRALFIETTNSNAEVSAAAQEALRKMDQEAAKRLELK